MAKRTAAVLAETFKKPSYQDSVAPQTSFRLNGLVHAKLKALAEMYDNWSLNDIVNKLLEAALEDFEAGMRGENIGDTNTPIYEGEKDIKRFHELTEQYGNKLLETLKKAKAKK